MNTSVDRIVIENEEETKATAYITHTAIDLKTQRPSKGSNSYPIIKEDTGWKIDIQRWVEARQAKSSPAEPKPAPVEPKPRSGLVISFLSRVGGVDIIFILLKFTIQVIKRSPFPRMILSSLMIATNP